MPAVGAPPPRGRVRIKAQPTQFRGGAVIQVGDVQSAGEDARLVLRAVSAHHRQRPAVRSLRHVDDVASGEPGDHAELAGGQVEQAQAVPEPVLA
jgi:hypothetical protein